MDRKMIYPGQIPLETDLLDTNRFALIGLGKLAAAVLGTTTLVNGLACTPTSPASMQVQVAPGEIYSLQNLDGTAYSSLAADTTHQILKQGLLMDAATISCTAPATVGQSINYLVQATYQDTDANAVVLPYYNASNPTQAYTGPNNSGTAQNTVRKGVCAVAVKAGIAATTGSQTTPAPDSGYVGLYVVTVAYGQATIVAGNITTASGAPILSETLLNKISQASGDARYATQTGFQQNAYSVANAGGTADAITATYSPAVAALTNGMTLNVRATAANATTTPTFTPASGTIAAKTIVKGAGAALVAGDIAGGGHWIELQYDAALDKWVLLNPATGVSVSQRSQIQPISASVASNALTLTLNPTNIDFRSSTLTSGAVNTRSVSSAISLTVPSGASLGTIGGQQARLAVLALDNNGTVELAVVNLAGGSPLLDETNLMTTVAMSAAATSATTAYSTTARTSLPYRVVGFVDITEATAGTWATAPTVVQGQGGQAISALQSIGYGQTWQNVGASRAYNTTYYNTTGKPIMVVVNGNLQGTSQSSNTLNVNGLTVAYMSQNTAGASTGISVPLTAIVPPGGSYSLSGNGSVVYWFELR